jgi:hypothetical protein
MKTIDFTPGMTVLDLDDAVVGEVKEVWGLTAVHGYLPVSRHLIADYGPIKGNREQLDSGEGYLQIRKDAFLGLGGEDVFVPLWAAEPAGEGALRIEPVEVAAPEPVQIARAA